jgi:hypothetical protein
MLKINAIRYMKKIEMIDLVALEGCYLRRAYISL